MAKDETNKKFWERFAFLYAPFMRKNKKMYYETYKTSQSYLSSEMKVLEIACGTGQFSRWIANDVKTLHATDYAIKMINQAKKKIKKDNLYFEVQDATNLLYENETFDAVFIANALHIMPNPTSALQEISRVLKDNGILIAPTFVYDNEKVGKVALIEKVGFKTFNKWNSTEYVKFIAEQNFQIIKSKNIVSDFLIENVVIAKKGEVTQ